MHDLCRRACVRAFALVAITLCAGCASPDPMREVRNFFKPKGEAQLHAGIQLYEDGRYPQAARSFEQAINAGLSDSGRVTAHKYLAFIHCVSRRERQCRGHFVSALEIDPGFELASAEAGHPMWGPVFRSVKARR